MGAGFAGSTVAHLLKDRFETTVLEAAAEPGGGCRTAWYGGHPYTFGPRVFFSRDEAVIATLTALTPIRRFDTISWTYVAADGAFYNYPLQGADIPRMPDAAAIEAELAACRARRPRAEDFEAYWLDAIGPTLYRKFVDRYSRKMWGVESNRALAANWEWVNRGTPIREGDVRLYQDQFQGYPEAPDGYNGFFAKALAGTRFLPSTRVTRFDSARREVHTSAGVLAADVIVNTLPVDALFGFTYGRLRYSGRSFIPLVLPVAQALPEGIAWVHYSGDEPYTRVTEFKKITGHASPHTLIGIELPNETSRYYPVQSAVERARFAQYQAMFPADFHSIGRHGSFQYKGIPDAIRDALDVAEAVLGRARAAA
ncbi:MAG: NAD(P)-binding protein [Alphaproteobacteria bacterium]|nr:NAD(P)-binding protein [Alphaproteobacteria bacterium]